MTVGPIVFAHPVARKQLVDEGEVVTFRKRDRTVGETWWRESRTGPKEGDVRVELIDDVDPRNDLALADHRPLSGFRTTERWQAAIVETNGGELPERGFLYRVETIEGGGDGE